MTNAKKTCPCPKCHATGKIRAFMHIANGDCFTCGGAGTIEIPAGPLPTRKAAPVTEERLLCDLRGMLAGAKRDPSGWATEEYDSYSDMTVGSRCAADIVRLSPPMRVKVLAAFSGVLSASEFAHVLSFVAREVAA